MAKKLSVVFIYRRSIRYRATNYNQHVFKTLARCTGYHLNFKTLTMDTTPTLHSGDGKTVAILSYLTIIGWLIAYFGFHQGRRTSLGSYHLRQALFLFLCYFVVQIILEVLLSITAAGLIADLMSVAHVLYIILIIVGILNASRGEEKPLPLIGRNAERYFPSL